MRGSSTLCSALARGSRLNVWNTNPISLLRIRANSSSDKSLTCCPLSQYSPAQGVYHLAAHVVVARELVREDDGVGQRRIAGAEPGRLDAGHRGCPTSAW